MPGSDIYALSVNKTERYSTKVIHFANTNSDALTNSGKYLQIIVSGPPDHAWFFVPKIAKSSPIVDFGFSIKTLYLFIILL